jgi:hypothetical protein
MSTRTTGDTWQRVRESYIRGQGSLRTLAERFGVSRCAVETRSSAEDWPALRKRREESLLSSLVEGRDAAPAATPLALPNDAARDLAGSLAEELKHLPALVAGLRTDIQTAPAGKDKLDAVRAFALLLEIWQSALPRQQPASQPCQIEAAVIGVAPEGWDSPAEPNPSPEPDAPAECLPIQDPAPALPMPKLRPAVGVVVKREPVAAHA